MFDIVNNTVTSYKMLYNKKTVIVGLSGGADSMSLLHFFVSNASLYGINVVAAHVNHCLRGEESERDSQFVSEQCKRLGVPLYIKKVDIAALAEKRRIGLEQCGREERYSFFEELSDNNQTVIATAHTASDNAETVLLNITRGCGIGGIKGIPPVRGNIIRPLIFVTRSCIEEYCKVNGISYVTDSSNLAEDYSRNKIRLSVMPLLKVINPSVEESINRLAETATRDLRFIDKFVVLEYDKCIDKFGLSVSKLQEVDENLLPRILKYAVSERLGIIPEKRHIDLISEMIHVGHGAVMPGRGCTVKIQGDSLVFLNSVETEKQEIIPFPDTSPQLGETYHYLNKTVCFSQKTAKSSCDGNKINKKLLNQRISCAIIHGGIVLRNRRSGDIFKPLGRNCTKTVKKLFTELKIPVEERDKRLVLADGSNVLWLEGVGLSQDAALTDGSDYFFTIEVMYDDE